jgi:RecB family exonuclease
MGKNWSASRVATYKTCKLQYKYKYIDEIYPVEDYSAEAASKGTSFHEIAEFMDSSKSYEDLVAFAKSHLENADFDTEKYPIIKTMPRFWEFWEHRIKQSEALGFTLSKENWEHFTIADTKFVGAIDVLLINKSTGEVKIYDYKSGGTAKVSDDYKRQLTIYALAIGQRLGYDIPTIVKKISTFLFFPLAKIENEEATDSTVARTAMLKSIKELKLRIEDLTSLVEELRVLIAESNSSKWDELKTDDASIGFYCSWCPYLGSIPEQCDGDAAFLGCRLTYLQGLKSPRSMKFARKS